MTTSEIDKIKIRGELTVLLVPPCKLEPLPCGHLEKISQDWVTTRPWRQLAIWTCEISSRIKYDKTENDANREVSMILRY